ncbi:MAG: Crp/Fnr family transcriptional regulator [Ardenticatenales bacterium]|nr:Crp/Fnr family transcriptional regulator [Ardenticatenales bacterium]
MYSTLKSTTLFASAGDDDIAAIAPLASFRDYEEGSLLFCQDHAAETIFILVEGMVKLVSLRPDGSQITLRTVLSKEPFGALGAVRADAHYPATAEAMKRSKVIAIRSDEFRLLLLERPHLAQGLLGVITRYVREMQERFQEMVVAPVPRRIARALVRLAAQCATEAEGQKVVTLPFTRQDLAEIVGTTLYSVSRTIAEWERQGIVSTGRKRITVTNMELIKSLAQERD